MGYSTTARNVTVEDFYSRVFRHVLLKWSL